MMTLAGKWTVAEAQELCHVHEPSCMKDTKHYVSGEICGHNRSKSYITLFRSIIVFCGSDSIPWNVFVYFSHSS